MLRRGLGCYLVSCNSFQCLSSDLATTVAKCQRARMPTDPTARDGFQVKELVRDGTRAVSHFFSSKKVGQLCVQKHSAQAVGVEVRYGWLIFTTWWTLNPSIFITMGRSLESNSRFSCACLQSCCKAGHSEATRGGRRHIAIT